MATGVTGTWFRSTAKTIADFVPATDTGVRTCTDSFTLTVAHGLGAIPDKFWALLKFTTAGGVNGFPQNTVWPIDGGLKVRAVGPSDGTFQLRADATNIYLDFAGNSGTEAIRRFMMSIAANNEGHLKDVDWTGAGYEIYVLGVLYS